MLMLMISMRRWASCAFSKNKVSDGTPAETTFTQPRLGCRVLVALANARTTGEQSRPPTPDARYLYVSVV